MITAEQVFEAGELLADREELINTLEQMLTATVVRIAYQVEATHRGSDEPRLYFRDGPEMAVTDGVRKLLSADTLKRIGAIDKKLRALGVEPPEGGHHDHP